VFQRRFWSTPVEDDVHLAMVIRYVEGNPLRAGLVSRAEQWEWSSLAARMQGAFTTSRSSVLPAHWCGLVNLSQRSEVLDRIRRDTDRRRGRPLERR
jgi:putative transposase